MLPDTVINLKNSLSYLFLCLCLCVFALPSLLTLYCLPLVGRWWIKAWVVPGPPAHPAGADSKPGFAIFLFNLFFSSQIDWPASNQCSYVCIIPPTEQCGIMTACISVKILQPRIAKKMRKSSQRCYWWERKQKKNQEQWLCEVVRTVWKNH